MYAITAAVEAILKHSPDALSVFRRKTITREILFHYLHDNDISVPTPATKGTLVEKICKFWNISSEVECFQEEAEQQTTSVAQTDHNVEELALKFTEWFYSMLNTETGVGPEHFWSDAKVKLNLIAGCDTVTEFLENDPEKIAFTLTNTKNVHNLYFNPNLSKEGVNGKIDPHGLVMVAACGVLHTNNCCVGVFEQMFLLARDPFSDSNWKIKSSELNLRQSSNVCSYPKLEDSNLLSIEET